MHGEPTDVALVEAFRAEYIYTGNAAKSGKKVGINPRTARDIARRLNADPSFTAERRSLRAQYLDDLVAMRMRVVAKAVERFLAPLPMPMVESGGMVTIIDKRPDYGNVVLNGEKNAQNLARLDAEKDGEVPIGRDVRITVVGPEGPGKPSE